MGEKPGGWSRGKKGGGGGGGDGKRRKGEKVGQFIHVCAAQTVDNGTEVDGRPTTPLMEQMKCGLTTCWLSHGMVAYDGDALKTLKLSFNNTSLIWHLSPWWWKKSIFGHFLEDKSLSCKGAQGARTHLFPHKMILASSCENVWPWLCLLAAFLHIFKTRMVSFTKNPPDILDISWRPLAPRNHHHHHLPPTKKNPLVDVITLKKFVFMRLEHICLCKFAGGELAFICWWV